MAKSELDKLREFKEQADEFIEELENEIWRLESHIKELEERLEDDPSLELTYMVNQQKYDLLKEHWENISLEDIEAICRI